MTYAGRPSNQFTDVRFAVVERARDLAQYAATWLARVPPERRANGFLIETREDGRVCYCALGAFAKNKLSWNRAQLRENGTYGEMFSPVKKPTPAEKELLGRVCGEIYEASDEGAHGNVGINQMLSRINDIVNDKRFRIVL